jgi:hypothetical protein
VAQLSTLGHSTHSPIMKTKRLLILGFSALLVLVDCRRPPSDVPTDGFRLTVQNMAADTDMQVARLAIVSSATATISIDSDGSHQSLSLRESPCRVGVSLVASRVAPPGQSWAYMHTLIRAQTEDGGHSALGPAFEALPIDTQLSSFFTITAKSGDYSFDTPVEIAKLRGKPVTITLKKGAQ